MIYLNGLTAISALGRDREEAEKSLRDNRAPGFTRLQGYLPGDLAADFGEISFPLDSPEEPDCRNSLLLMHCLNQIRDLTDLAFRRYGASRIGVVLGTSTSAISDVEKAGRADMAAGRPVKFSSLSYEVGNVSAFIGRFLGVKGPCYTVATACSSSARALISARDLLKAGICDAVIAGGADSLSAISISGFYALGALSLQRTRPFHRERDGINIGEGAGIALLTREPLEKEPLRLLGFGATSDAHHISAPEPTGTMAWAAMTEALNMAGIKPEDLGYLHFHGTGTRLNDAMEGRVARELLGGQVPLSSTKHLCGHTLGAAGIMGAYVSSLVLRGAMLPRHDYREEDYREEFPDIDLVTVPGRYAERPYVMSNSLAFGGNNVSLVFSL